MSTISIGLIVFACVFGGAVLGILLQARLPQHHLSTETKDVVKLAMGLVATMAALVLGLLVASAKGAYDTQKNEVIEMAAKITFLDRVLANYGPGSAEIRALLRQNVERMVQRLWPDDKPRNIQREPLASGGELLYDSIQKLSPETEKQQAVKTQALHSTIEIGQLHSLLFHQAGSSISTPLLAIVVSWLAIIFLSFGLFAPRHGTAITALMVAALSVSAAIFLTLELDRPFGGLIEISRKPMESALEHIGR